ncbi:VOC family protein [Klebsiella pneumoniae]|uniref:VOC family protein n=1 Tax=Klebsiella pneumoniae TaxID=573 RepID=A0A923ELN2_KLEPN|nr:VOC family protein [Klebsiella pneumoniae]
MGGGRWAPSGWGTRNALSYFGLTYIEFLAIADPDELRAATDKFSFRATPHGCCRRMRRCFGWRCAATTSTPPGDQLRRTGVTVSPIVDGQRNDPQGNIIRWRIFTIDGDTAGLVYPLCCSGRRRRHPADAAARPEAGRAASAGRHYA